MQLGKQLLHNLGWIVFYLNWIWTGICFIVILCASQISKPVFSTIIMYAFNEKWLPFVSSIIVVFVGFSGFFTTSFGGKLLQNYGFYYFYIFGTILTFTGLIIFKISQSYLIKDKKIF